MRAAAGGLHCERWGGQDEEGRREDGPPGGGGGRGLGGGGADGPEMGLRLSSWRSGVGVLWGKGGQCMGKEGQDGGGRDQHFSGTVAKFRTTDRCNNIKWYRALQAR